MPRPWRVPGVPCVRREFLRSGTGLAVSGLLLPDLICPGAKSQASPVSCSTSSRAKSCIVVYLLGGPSHIDMFDLKPEAPAEIRGPFRPIATSVPGLEICEHLPRLAGMAERFSLVRSVSYTNNNHTPMIYYTLTGRVTERPEQDNDVRPPQRTDFPHIGSVVSKLRAPDDATLPSWVAIPELAIRSSTAGEFKRVRSPLRGGAAGFLGPHFDPLCVDGEPGSPEAVPSLLPPVEVTAERFEKRSELLDLLDRRLPVTHEHDAVRRHAALLTGSAARGTLAPFTLDGETPRTRERYGHHCFGRAMLLARRLVEAGVPFVAIHFNEMTVCDGWDTHGKNFEGLKDELLPMLDQGLAALLDDLAVRGRLHDTLVQCYGEFGRTPRINANAGRDHWGPCSTAFFAGGGLAAGQVVGASDGIAAYPVTDPVDPADIHATMYHAMGLDCHSLIRDQLQRPAAICTGRAIQALL